MTHAVTYAAIRTNIGEHPIKHRARAQIADLMTPVSCGLADLSLTQTKRETRTTYCTDEYPSLSPSSPSLMIVDEAGKTLRDAIDNDIMELILGLDAKDIPIPEIGPGKVMFYHPDYMEGIKKALIKRA